jgi:hypothetical protein
MNTKVRSLISEEKKIIFLWTPKAACTSVKNIFYNFIGTLPDYPSQVHEKEWRNNYGKQSQILPNNIQDYTVIQFCRNPYKRAVSSYLECLNYKIKGECGDGDSFSNFITFLYNLYENKIKCKNCLHHSSVQFMTDKLNHIIKIEDIEKQLKDINDLYQINIENIIYDEHSNKSKLLKNYYQGELRTYEDYLTEESISMINKVYGKDIEFFGYDFL